MHPPIRYRTPQEMAHQALQRAQAHGFAAVPVQRPSPAPQAVQPAAPTPNPKTALIAALNDCTKVKQAQRLAEVLGGELALVRCLLLVGGFPVPPGATTRELAENLQRFGWRRYPVEAMAPTPGDLWVTEGAEVGFVAKVILRQPAFLEPGRVRRATATVAHWLRFG